MSELDMDVVVAKIISLLLMASLTILTGLLPLRLMKHVPQLVIRHRGLLEDVLKGLRCFTGGIFLATCFLHLLPYTRVKVQTVLVNVGSGSTYAVCELLIMVGFYAVVFVEQIINILYRRAQRDESRRGSYDLQAATVEDTKNVMDGPVDITNIHVAPPPTTDPPEVSPEPLVENCIPNHHPPREVREHRKARPQGHSSKEGSEPRENNSNQTTKHTEHRVHREHKEHRERRERSRELREHAAEVRDVKERERRLRRERRERELRNHREARRESRDIRDHRELMLEQREPTDMETVGFQDGLEVKRVVCELSKADESSRGHYRKIIFVMALSFHGVFEAMCIGLQSEESNVWTLCFAVVAHRCVLAFKLGLDLCLAKESQGTAWLCVGTFTFISALGIVIGTVISSSAELYSDVNVPDAVLQCLATGTIFYIVVFDIFFKDLDGQNDLRRVSCTFVGFVVMAIVFAVTRR